MSNYQRGYQAERDVRFYHRFASAEYNASAAFIWSRTAPEMSDADWEAWVAGWNYSVQIGDSR